MEFVDVVKRRRMVRTYLDRPVPTELVDQLLDLAVRAPSAGFSQGWCFVVLEGRAQTRIFWDAVSKPAWRSTPGSKGDRLQEAPVVIVPFADKQAYLERYSEPDKAYAGMQDEENWPVPFWLTDCAFAVENLLLAATNAGLGALFFGLPFGHAALLEALGAPPRLQALGAITLGWPDPEDTKSPSLRRGRRPAESVVHRGRWAATMGE